MRAVEGKASSAPPGAREPYRGRIARPPPPVLTFRGEGLGLPFDLGVRSGQRGEGRASSVPPDDYDVIQEGEIVGRIYRMKADRELLRWMIRLWAPPPGPSGGVSASLDEAMAAFRAKWDAQG